MLHAVDRCLDMHVLGAGHSPRVLLCFCRATRLAKRWTALSVSRGRVRKRSCTGTRINASALASCSLQLNLLFAWASRCCGWHASGAVLVLPFEFSFQANNSNLVHAVRSSAVTVKLFTSRNLSSAVNNARGGNYIILLVGFRLRTALPI